jgi:hypothetical protein
VGRVYPVAVGLIWCSGDLGYGSWEGGQAEVALPYLP